MRMTSGPPNSWKTAARIHTPARVSDLIRAPSGAPEIVVPCALSVKPLCPRLFPTGECSLRPIPCAAMPDQDDESLFERLEREALFRDPDDDDDAAELDVVQQASGEIETEAGA